MYHEHHHRHHNHHHKQEHTANEHYNGIGRIEAVSVSVNYPDFLDEALYYNLQHFDEYVVVTSHEDRATKEVCRRHSVTCIATDMITERKDKFNKGHGVNIGLSHLRQTGWIVQLDADIVLPDRFRNMLDKARLNKENIYGCDRVNVQSREIWEKLKSNNAFRRQFEAKCLVAPPENLPLGARVIHNEYGYVPIGFFQLFHGSKQMRYPYNSGGAELTDVLFSLLWPAEKRIHLPHIIPFHLESEAAKLGANWQGRTTKAFR